MSFQLFTRLLEDYLTINADREELIEKSLGQPGVNHKVGQVHNFFFFIPPLYPGGGKQT